MNPVEVIVGAIVTLCSVGGAIYLVVEHFLNRRQHGEEVRHQQGENIRQAVEYGVPMVEIYNQINDIVKRETTPIQNELNQALGRITVLEQYVCYKPECQIRIRRLDRENTLNNVNNEAKRTICGARSDA